MSNAKTEKHIVAAVVMTIEAEKTTIGDRETRQQTKLLKRRFEYALRKLIVREPDVQSEEEKLLIEQAKEQVWSAFRKLRNGVALTEEEKRLPDIVCGKQRELPEPSAEQIEKLQKWARRHKVKLRPYLPPLTQQELNDLRDSKVPTVVLKQKAKCGDFNEAWVEILPGDVRADILLSRLLSSETAERFEIHMLSAEVDFWRKEYEEQYEEVYGAKFERLVEFILTFLPAYSEVKKAREIDKANKQRSPEERHTMIKALCPELPDWLVTELVSAKKGDRYEKHPLDLALKHTAKLLGKTYSLAHMKKLLRESKQVREQVIRVLEASEQTSKLSNEYKEVINYEEKPVA